MDRRRFLIQAAKAGSALFLLPAGLAAGCNLGTTSSRATPAPVSPDDGLTYTSDLAGTHTHDFTIPSDDLTTPPGQGLLGSTTATLGHHHEVALTAMDLANIESGGTINRVTSIVDGHLHNFKFSLSTAEAPGPTPPSVVDSTADAGS
jgi:hypothetical protein